MRVIKSCSLAVLWCSLWLPCSAQVDFESEVLPIFQSHCYDCHGPEKRESGFQLNLRENAFKGGDLGERTIIAGDATSSPLFRYVNGDEPELLMPPHNSGYDRLVEGELETLRTWIDQGASWPDQFAGDTKSKHWSLQPLVKPTVPSDSTNPIDAFVQQALSVKQLRSAAPADRRTLIRRLTFDLIGLPPTPQQIDDFVADKSPDAYATLVNRLLDSQHYGERWARHWLDVVRFTESQGFEYDRLRDNAWHYRDYVIKSFNHDKPYDQFMREQIAGDVIEPVTRDGIVATSLLVCGPYDQAGNSQKNATQRAVTREDELEDLIGVVSQTFLGLTINCARCHAHKFDPISHDEYYRIKSVFEGVKHGERAIASDAEKRARAQKRMAMQQKLDAVNKRIADLESTARAAIAANRVSTSKTLGPEPFAQWTFDGTSPEAPASGLAGDMAGELLGGAKIEDGVLKLPHDGAHFKSAPLSKTLQAKTLEAWVALDDLDQRGGAAISIESESGSVFDAIVFGEQQPRKWMVGSDGFQRTQPLAIADEQSDERAFVHVAVVYSTDGNIAFYRNGEAVGKPYKPVTPLQTFEAGRSHVLLGMRHTGGGRPWLRGEIKRAALYDRALSAPEVMASFQADGNSMTRSELLASLRPEQFNAYRDALAGADAARRDLAEFDKVALPVSYVGTRVQPEPTQRLKRGEVTSPAEVVAPGALAAIENLSAEFGLAADAPEAERRLKFADWLSDPRNPLPARVMANRIWYLHFGQGLVATPNDFGAGGSPPSHPELLDWLATQLIESGWSVKTLHRLIVNSATYQQSSNFDPDAAAVDADNQLLWRFTPQRLEAEAIRDAMLAASGSLNAAAGGPGFRPFITTEFNATFYTPVDRNEPEFNRRTVYRINVNSGKDPLLDAFDCPDPGVKTPRRGTTTTPLQALELMNSAFVQRMSARLAERVLKKSDNDVGAAIDYAYRLTLGRKPTAVEAARAVAAAKERDLKSVSWALLNSTEFIYVR